MVSIDEDVAIRVLHKKNQTILIETSLKLKDYNIKKALHF